MLHFDARWRFEAPPDGVYLNHAIPLPALQVFKEYIGKVTTHGDRWKVVEHFKGYLCGASGTSYMGCSSLSWAETDLEKCVEAAAGNAPLFLEAFYDACNAITNGQCLGSERFAPDAALINELCEKYNIGYIIAPPDLVPREKTVTIAVPLVVAELTVADSALEAFQQSLSRSEQLLGEGHYREAIQETLWVLESVATVFRGLKIDGETVHGKYFNAIIKDLKPISKGTAMEQALEWVSDLHGYLSAPGGGGIRHGQDVASGKPVGKAETRLFCNLIRSYISYFLNEHERLRKQHGEFKA